MGVFPHFVIVAWLVHACFFVCLTECLKSG